MSGSATEDAFEGAAGGDPFEPTVSVLQERLATKLFSLDSLLGKRTEAGARPKVKSAPFSVTFSCLEQVLWCDCGLISCEFFSVVGEKGAELSD